MSWREILGFRPQQMLPSAHNPQNTHNLVMPPSCADIADSALTESEQESRLLEALSTACSGLTISASEVRKALAPEDVQDWLEGKFSAEALAAVAGSLLNRQAMDEGKRPAHYTEIATCAQCGPVWLFVSGNVFACPWCWNSAANRPIPRPLPVSCGDCVYFERRGQSPLGRCKRGAPEALGGRWDSDKHTCERYIPKKRNDR